MKAWLREKVSFFIVSEQGSDTSEENEDSIRQPFTVNPFRINPSSIIRHIFDYGK